MGDLTLGSGETNNPTGDQRVALPPTALFKETFDLSGGYDPVQWIASAGGTGVAPTQSQGGTTLNGGTTANSFSKLTSVPSFAPTQPGFLFHQANNNVPFPALTTAYILMGIGISSATPTIAAPCIEFVGYEIGLTGALQPVTYAGGVRQPIPFISNWQPPDANPHKYFFYFKGDICYFCMDDRDNKIAQFTTGALGPNVNTLPLLYQVVSNGGAAASLTINGVTLGDTAHSGTRIQDGTYPWRQQTIGVRGDAVTSLMDGNKATYAAVVFGITPVAGDTLVLTGSASKTIRVTRIEISGTATATTEIMCQAVKRTTADTGGTTGTAPTVVLLDSSDPAPSATIALYTVAPTPGTGAAVRSRALFVDVSAATTVGDAISWEFGNGPKRAIVLRGTSQQCSIFFGSSPAGGVFQLSIEWTEE